MQTTPTHSLPPSVAPGAPMRQASTADIYLTKLGVRRSLERSDDFLPSLLQGNKKRNREAFTDEDVPIAKALRQQREESWYEERMRHDLEVAEKEKRDLALDEACRKEPGTCWGARYMPETDWGVFLVTQEVNPEYDTFTEFVVVAPSETAARMTHPAGRRECIKYRKTDAERDREWAQYGHSGPAPDWFLGDGDSWVHAAFVSVTRISDYKSPSGQEPKHHIVCSSYRSA